MSRSPSFLVQKRIAANIHKTSFTDHWQYAVSKQWLTRYENQFKGQPDVVSTVAETTCTALMVDPEIDCNEFISEKWWKILVSWYGLEKNAMVFRRPLSSMYVTVSDGHNQTTVLSNKEMDVITISGSMLSNIEDKNLHKVFKLYAWDSVEFLEYKIRRILEIPVKYKSRLWINVQENENDVIFDCLESDSKSIIAKLAPQLPWLYKHLSLRDQKAALQTSDPFLFLAKNIKIIVAVEEVSMELAGTCNEKENRGWVQYAVGLEGEGESIITLATINSNWDELFTNCVDELTKDVGDIAADKRGILINSAKEIVNEKISQTEKLADEMADKISKLNEKEKTLLQRENDVNRMEEEQKRKLVQYKEGLDRFMKEKKRLESEWERVREQNMITDSQIKLNIGGEMFTTSLTTLTNVQDSEFVHLFCGTYVAKPSADGSYFIDRDATHFRHILNYLRNGPKTVASFPNNEHALYEILNEAKYYKLSELEVLIQEKINNMTTGMIGDYVSYPSFSSLSSN